MFKFIVTSLIVFYSQNHVGQNSNNKRANLLFLKEFLSIPNNSDNHSDIENNLSWLIKEFNELNFKTKRLHTPKEDILYAEYFIDKKLPTVLFYMHFDGQPVDQTKWEQHDAYTPVIKSYQNGKWHIINELDFLDIMDDWRVFARSASDDKGPIVMFLVALQRLKEVNGTPSFNVKVILDSHEEKGSPYLKETIDKNADLLKSDYFVVFDGPLHDSLNPTLIYGVRGAITLTLTIYGPSKPPHSGHFGNYAPNPVFRASKLLSSMKDDNGKVKIKHFYTGLDFSKKEKRVINQVPDDEEKIKSRAGFKQQESVGATYQEAMQYPSLNIIGIHSGWVGENKRTIVPSKCIVEMDIRTVPESKSEFLVSYLKAHVNNQGFTILDHEPTLKEFKKIEKPLFFNHKVHMYPFRTSFDSKIGNWLRRAIYKNNKKIVQIRMSGGSVPLSFFINRLNVPTVLVPLVNPDNNQHSPNENLRLGNYFEGIDRIETILKTAIDQ